LYETRHEQGWIGQEGQEEEEINQETSTSRAAMRQHMISILTLLIEITWTRLLRVSATMSLCAESMHTPLGDTNSPSWTRILFPFLPSRPRGEAIPLSHDHADSRWFSLSETMRLPRWSRHTQWWDDRAGRVLILVIRKRPRRYLEDPSLGSYDCGSQE
jgi:hypothetical protein